MNITSKSHVIIALISMTALSVAGCSTTLAPENPESPTVADAYFAAMRNSTLYREQRIQKPPMQKMSAYQSSALPAIARANQMLNAQFPTLPNPQSQMYILGHFAGDNQIPVSGHFVPFSLYTKTWYALPNEVLEPYSDGQFVS